MFAEIFEWKMAMLVKTTDDFSKNGTVYFRNSDQNVKEVFSCHRCSSPLISGYVPQCFAGISLKCAKCENVMTTPAPDAGDVFPKNKTLSFRDELYRVGGEVQFSSDIVAVQDEVHKNTLEDARPKLNSGPSELKDVLNAYCEFTGREEGELRARLSRFQSSGRSGCLEEPLIWAVSTLEAKHHSDPRAREIAMTWLTAFAGAVDNWVHHPRFLEVAKEMKGDGATFFHPRERNRRDFHRALERYFNSRAPRRSACAGAGVLQFRWSGGHDSVSDEPGMRMNLQMSWNPNFDDPSAPAIAEG